MAPTTQISTECEQIARSAEQTLRQAHELLLTSHDGAMAATDLLRLQAGSWRRQLPQDEWRQLVTEVIRPHPVATLMLEDPFTARSFHKPRGYAGDAVLLDFIYHHPDNAAALEQATPRGRAIAAFSTDTPAPRAVRNRAHLIALEIERFLLQMHRPRVLSVACGHMRELEMIPAPVLEGLGDFVAIDADAESVGHLSRRAATQVQAHVASIQTLWTDGAAQWGDFDFIYAAGLYDYLPDRIARRLTENLFRRLRPGGRLWIANFLPGIADVGYMEAFMDWWLIYRSEAQMMSLCERLGSLAGEIRPFSEPENNIQFVAVSKKL